jgi:chromosome segregation ATPase
MKERGTYVDLPYGLYLELKTESDERGVPMKQVHIEALEAYLGVSTAESGAVLRRKLERKKRELREEKEAIEERQRRVSSIESTVESIEEALETRESAAEAYMSELDSVLDEVESGTTPHIWETSRTTSSLADEFDKSPSEVIYDLKQRAAETDRDIYTTNFMKAPKAEQVRRNGNEQPIQEVVSDE